MGNLVSSNHQFRELHHRLQTLEGIDKNKDGLITKDEFNEWKNSQKRDLEMFRESITKLKDKEYQEKMSDYEKQIDSLKEINRDLEKKLIILSQKKSNQVSDVNDNKILKNKVLSELSKQKIQEFVDHLIDNDSVNIKYLPDFVERQIYKNVFNIILGLLSEILEGSSIDLLGHEITLALNPKIEQIEKEKEKEE